MSTRENEAADLAAAMRAAAEQVKACIVAGFPEDLKGAAIPLVVLDQEDGVRLVCAAAPKVLYLVEIDFDPDEETAEVTDELLQLGVTKTPSSLSAAQRRAASHAGEIRTTLAAFIVDGIMHTVSASADWHDAFEEVVEQVLAAARDDEQAQRRSEARSMNEDVAAKAALLARHPSFNFGRVSFDKRLTLAEALFASEEALDLREVTRCAENLFWLEQSGFKP